MYKMKICYSVDDDSELSFEVYDCIQILRHRRDETFRDLSNWIQTLCSHRLNN
jgi:hypothetical protein